MSLSRRDLLRLGLGTSALLACGRRVPAFLANSAATLAAEPAANDKGRVLVVVELTGGNDGLNTVVPFADDVYRKLRPRLRLEKEALVKVDDRVGLHPSLAGFGKLLEAGQLAIVQSVGYPNPNRSHFESMATWHCARLRATRDTSGWLARCLDARPLPPGGDVPALHINTGTLPQALTGGERFVPSVANLEQFARRLGIPESAGAAEQRTALDALAGEPRGTPGSLLQFVERTSTLTYASSARLEAVLKDQNAAKGYPEFYGLARRLKVLAQLIKAGLSTSIFYTQLDGFDTHANQLGNHGGLLRQVGDSLKAFLDDLNKAGEGKRVVVLVFSEFGRRLAENASAGTDHGTAAPVFLLGAGVKAGLHGPYPDLEKLEDGDPKHAIDFRSVYAALLQTWLSVPAEKVLGGQFEALPVVG
jgi:uncharacterized protein (DUF1501 family)